jgi:hypothetical protein
MAWFDGRERAARSLEGGEDLDGGWRKRSDGKEVVVDLAAGERALSDSQVKMNKSELKLS